MADVERLRELTRGERRCLCELLDELDDGDWQEQTLCGEWTVRELVAHLVAWDGMLMHEGRLAIPRAAARWVVAMARARFDVARFNERSIERDQEEPSRLRQRFSTLGSERSRWLFDRIAPGAQLAEYVVHRQDIARPLGLQSDVATPVLLAALNGIAAVPGIDARRLLREQRWVADDLDWAAGTGPELHDSGLDILMALAGRPPGDSPSAVD